MSIPCTNSSQDGSALLMVLLVALIVSAVGGTLLIMSDSDHRISANERDAERALYAARAGLAYAYHLYSDGLLTPTVAGTPFNSFAPAVSSPLEGADFTGTLEDLSLTMNQGSLYRIEATGTFNRASRTTELIFQVVPDAFKYGYMAFNDATLHNHGASAADFRIQSTILSNGNVSVPNDLTIEGTIVSAGDVSISNNATITRDVFANGVNNSGTISGQVRLITAVEELPDAALSWDIVDAQGTKYAWYNGSSSPGSVGGNPPVGGTTSYSLVDYDTFNYNIFNRNGALLPNPNINVTRYVAPPKLDYAAMKAEADKNDPTYFATQSALVTYLGTKKVNETIAGRDLVTVKVGTPDAPEFIYVDDDVYLQLGALVDDPGSGELAADAVYIEGGMYITGKWDFDGPDMMAAANSPPYPGHPDYYALSMNALPYCYPALIAYEEPATGSFATWTPDDTPAIGGGSGMNMSASNDEGPVFFNGVVYVQDKIHLHHTKEARELIRFNGAELAFDLHNCDKFWFSYDPNIRCTRFLTTEAGTPEVVSFREIR